MTSFLILQLLIIFIPSTAFFIHKVDVSIFPNLRCRSVLPASTVHLSPNNDIEDNDVDSIQSPSVISRFLSPRIDDTALPISDALISQVVGPTLQVFWLSANHAPLPTWLVPFFASSYRNSVFDHIPLRGALVVPTLVHGAGLAFCWLLGALAARLYESDAFDTNTSLPQAVSRFTQAGAFATGVLIFCTQLDLLLEYGHLVQPGMSEDIDIRLLSAVVEVINDVVFEAVSLGTWRFYHFKLMDMKR